MKMILSRLHFVLLTGGAMAVGCSASDIADGSVCTKEARAGITVDVRDSVSNALVGLGSRIIAREGVFADTSTDTPLGNGPYSLVFERAGTYDLSVVQSGYRTWSKPGVQVTKGSCHVTAVAVTARLQK